MHRYRVPINVMALDTGAKRQDRQAGLHLGGAGRAVAPTLVRARAGAVWSDREEQVVVHEGYPQLHVLACASALASRSAS